MVAVPTRREWLMGMLALFTSTITGCSKAAGLALAKQRTKTLEPIVARAKREGVRKPNGEGFDSAILESMVGAAIATAASETTPLAAFKKLFRPSDVVGIKVGTLAGRGLSPHPELVQLLVHWLVAAGVREQSIIIWDRLDHELERAGFSVNRTARGPRCIGTNQDYDWTPREWGAGGSCFAGVLVNEITALINVAVLKDHDLAGVSAGMKNWYGTIHNPNKYHDDGCDPYIAHLAAFPLIRDKLRLTVIDGLVAQCHGGPAHSPRFTWPLNTVLSSLNPVALDAICWKVIEDQRKAQGMKSLTEEQREPKWLASAAKLGLGENRLDRISLVDT